MRSLSFTSDLRIACKMLPAPFGFVRSVWGRWLSTSNRAHPALFADGPTGFPVLLGDAEPAIAFFDFRAATFHDLGAQRIKNHCNDANDSRQNTSKNQP